MPRIAFCIQTHHDRATSRDHTPSKDLSSEIQEQAVIAKNRRQAPQNKYSGRQTYGQKAAG